MGSYTEFVTHLSSGIPSLAPLANFLKELQPQTKAHSTCSIDYVEVRENGTGQIQRTSLNHLLGKLRNFLADTIPETKGLCVLIEDVSPGDIDALGSLLDIDPRFFCGHTATNFEEIERYPPTFLMSSLPSSIFAHDFMNFHYQKVIDLGEHTELRKVPYNLCLAGNSPRAVRRMPALSARNIGFVRSCFSILHKNLENERWICLMLTDSASADIVVDASKIKESELGGFRTPQVPYRNRFNNFGNLLPYSEFAQGHRIQDQQPATILDEISKLLCSPENSPEAISSKSRSLLLALCPIKIILTEWLLYVLLMSRYIKLYEYSIETVNERIPNLESEDILDLYRWRRRTQQSLNKLLTMKWFIEQRSEVATITHPFGLLIHDIEHISAQIGKFGSTLETMVPLVASMIQLVDSRRSMKEAIYVKRLTYIALIFLPLSYVATLFSMSDDFAIGSTGFKIYLVTAIPLLFLVLVISSFPFRVALTTMIAVQKRYSNKKGKHKGSPDKYV